MSSCSFITDKNNTFLTKLIKLPISYCVCQMTLNCTVLNTTPVHAVRYLIIICFFLSFSNYSTYVFSVLFMLVFCFVFLFSVLCILCCIVFVLFCVLFLLLCCLLPIFVQVYRPLPPGGNQIAVNK